MDTKLMVSFRMKLSLKKRLEAQAEVEGRSLSGMIMFALNKYLADIEKQDKK